jgi:GTPase
MLDYAKIKINGGNGGKGSVSFRREKFVPKGGPDGGDGGKGGDFYIEASNDVSTLLDFQFMDHFEAESGEPGSTALKRGKDGKDYILKVPVGSIIKVNKLVADLVVNSKRNSRKNEPNVYEQKLFNYKKMEKLRRQEMSADGRLEQPIDKSENSSNNVIDGSQNPQGSETDIISKLDHIALENTNSESSLVISNEEQNDEVMPSEEYKVYKFSARHKANDNIPQVQNSTEVPLYDLDVVGSKILIARGGRGGRGNTRFKSNENKAPHAAEPGQKGEHLEIEITLKMVANIGLIGMPNAGKSTLLSKLTAAAPKIANYPFTTLEPNLGVMYEGDKSFVLADIPGLIEGASAGKGLGFKFLQHTERTAVLLHLIEMPNSDNKSPHEIADDIINTYSMIRAELERYGKTLPDKKEIIVINKIDKIPDDLRTTYIPPIEEKLKKLNNPYAFVSAQDNIGLNGLKKIIVKELVPDVQT